MNDTKKYGLSIFYGLTALTGCIFNSLVLLAIITKKELRRRKANLFLCSLCLSDFLTSAYSVTYHLIHLHPKIYSGLLSVTYCRLTQYFIYALAFSSSLCLAGVCIDRYIAITKPFMYISDKFSKFITMLLIWPWIQSFCTSIPAASLPIITVLNSTEFPCGINSSQAALEILLVLSTINIILPFICILTSCIVVYRVAKRQLLEIRLQVPSVLGEQSAGSSSSSIRSVIRSRSPADNKVHTVKIKRDDKQQKESAKLKFNRNFREEAKITFATIAVVIGFVVAWVPYYVTRLLFLMGLSLSNDVHTFGTAFVLANSAWNPLLIFLLRSDVRKSIKLLCSRNKDWTKILGSWSWL